MLTSCYYYRVVYKDYVNVYIDRKFKELKLNSITFLAKNVFEINGSKQNSPKNVETFGRFQKAPLLPILKRFFFKNK